MRKRRLGRGLDALLPTPSVGEEFRHLLAEQLEPNPEQPRSDFPEEDLEGLTSSIASRGLLEPIVVRAAGDRFQIVAGERRWRAARKAGLEVVPVVIREVEDGDLGLLALVENLQREDLNPMDEAAAFRRLAAEGGLTHEQIAAEVGRSRAAVTNAVRLLDLAPEVRRLIATGKLRAAAGRALIPLDPADQHRLATEIVRDDLSVREVEGRIRRLRAARKQGDPKSGALDANTRDAGLQMEHAVGLPVRIVRRGKGGSVRVRFFSEDDLHRIFTVLTAKREAPD